MDGVAGDSQAPPTPPGGDSPRAAAAFVWGVWALLSALLVGFVLVYGQEFPFCDEWTQLQPMVGAAPITPQWLWSQHNEHRIPLGRLVMTAALRLTRCDFRTAPRLDAVALVLSCAVYLAALRRLRGRLYYADALFPVLLLQIGHWENLIWGFQVSFILWTIPTQALLLVLLRKPQEISGGAAALAAFCLLLLPLFGAQGHPFVPGLALWLLGVAAVRWRAGGRRGAAGLALAAVLAVAETASYFVDYHRCTYHPLPRDNWDFCRGLLEFLASSWGTRQTSLWPCLMWLTPVLFAGCGLALLARLVRAGDRLRAFGLIMFLGGAVGLAGGVSWGRSGFGEYSCTSSRYFILAVPGLLGCYCAFGLFPRRPLARCVEMALLSCALVSLSGNIDFGLLEAKQRRDQMKAFGNTLRTEQPLAAVIEQYKPILHPDDEVLFKSGILALHRLGARRFNHMHCRP